MGYTIIAMRILGIDYGDRRIGLAISDESATIATPLKVYLSQSMRKDLDFVASLCKEKNVDKIILGLPLNMDGTKGERANKTESFGKVLEKITVLEVIYKDERLSSVFAERALSESGNKHKKNKELVDTTAAMVILQGYLDKLRVEK